MDHRLVDPHSDAPVCGRPRSRMEYRKPTANSVHSESPVDSKLPSLSAACRCSFSLCPPLEPRRCLYRHGQRDSRENGVRLRYWRLLQLSVPAGLGHRRSDDVARQELNLADPKVREDSREVLLTIHRVQRSDCL